MELDNIKVKVRNHENSRKLQEYLFSKGFKWLGEGKKVSYIYKPYLYLYSSKKLTHGQDPTDFKRKEFEEKTIEELLKNKSLYKIY